MAIQSSGQGPTDLSQPRVTSGSFPETSGKYPPLSHCTGSAVWEDAESGGRTQQAAFRKESVMGIPEEEQQS